MNTRSFIIPASNKNIVEEQIIKLNRRASKLNLEEINLVWGKAYLNDKNVLTIPVNVSGPLSVKYDGWIFIATLQHLNTGENIIRSINNEWIIPPKYHNSGSQCEHCNVNRYRKDTYLVLRECDGKTFQCGSSCISDFIGNNSPDDLLKKATLISELVHFMNGACSGGGSNNDELFYITNFLTHTVACIRHHGWISKSAASSSGEMATVVRVMSNIDEAPSGTMPCPITPEDSEKAKLAAEWAESLPDEDCDQSDYLHNIRAITRTGLVDLRTIGFAASIVNAYDRAQPKQNTKKISTYVGALKVREDFNLTLTKIFSGVSNYGPYEKFIFNDERGNIIIWFNSSQEELKIGARYKIRGTVKEHSEFRGEKQTIINRCEILTYYDKSF